MVNIYAFSLEWKTVLIILGGIFLLLIIIHLIGNRMRFKGKSRRQTKKLQNKFADDSNNVADLIDFLSNDSPRYNGKFKSLKSGEKRRVIKFLKKWLKKIPMYVEITSKAKDKKYARLNIGATRDLESRKFERVWTYRFYSSNEKKNIKKNLKKLIKFMDKTRSAKATIRVITNIFTDIQDRDEGKDNYQCNENGVYITYSVNKKPTK